MKIYTKKCINCGFKDSLKTAIAFGGTLEVKQKCRKCGSKAYKILCIK